MLCAGAGFLPFAISTTLEDAPPLYFCRRAKSAKQTVQLRDLPTFNAPRHNVATENSGAWLITRVAPFIPLHRLHEHCTLS